MGLISRILGRLQHSGVQADKLSVEKLVTMKLKKDTKYMIAVSEAHMSFTEADRLQKGLRRLGVPNLVVLTWGDPAKMFYVIRQEPGSDLAASSPDTNKSVSSPPDNDPVGNLEGR